jgi:hypothetical protein
MIIKMNRTSGLIVMSLVLSLLGGCAATQVAIGKKDLKVNTRTSTAIFVDPVSKDKRTVYLDVKSGVMEFDRRDFKNFVTQSFAQNTDGGFVVVDDPDKAQFQMLVYVLNLEEASPTAAEAALNQGYVGGIAAGAAAGALINSNNRYTGAAAGGLIGGAAELIGGALVHDVTFMLVCDVKITEKAKKGVYVRKDTQISEKVSDAGSSKQSVSEVSDRKAYRTRIVTTANQANLDLADAKNLMFKKTAYAMAGFF